MFDNLFSMLGPSTLAFLLGPIFLAVGIAAAVPNCSLTSLRGPHRFAR
jgi:hypothetical protein